MESNDDGIFSLLYKNSDLSEALDDSCGLLVSFENYCVERSSTSIGTEKLRWRDESQTWKLIRMLTLRREQQYLDRDLPSETRIRPFRCDAVLTEDIIEADFQLQENIVVREWLQECAEDFEPCEIKHSHLQATLDHITVQSRDLKLGISKPSNEIVTELDPDSTTRQEKQLVAEDLIFEQQLNKTIFNFIRRGRLMEAVEFCKDSQQFYKAATLMGGLVHYDPLDKSSDDVFGSAVEAELSSGNQNKSLWKAVCYQLASDNRVDRYERAVYGSLAGDVTSVLPACKSWQDYLWAFYNGIIETKIQKQLHPSSSQDLAKEAMFSLPFVDLSERQLFERLEGDEFSGKSPDFFRLVQRHCITNEYGQLFEKIKNDLEENPIFPESTRISLRFLAHLVLLWRNLGLDDKPDCTQLILLKYIDHLIVSGNGELIPMFYEPLPQNIQTAGYSTFLATLKGDKTKYYNLGKSFRLNMMAVCEEAVKKSTEQLLSIPLSIDHALSTTFVPATAQITDEDLYRMSSLDWLTFEDQQIKKLFEYSNILLRKYLILGKLNCVKWIMDHYSLSSNELEQDEWDIEPFFLTEQLDYFALINCFEVESQWRNLQSEKPKEEYSSLI